MPFPYTGVGCDPCQPCGGAPTPLVCAGCDPDTIATTWQFVIAGVTDFLCGNCVQLNKTYTMTQVTPGVCFFKTPSFIALGPPCIPREHVGDMSIGLSPSQDFAEVRVRADTGIPVNALYRMDASDFDCAGPNVFQKIQEEGMLCQTFPDTVTVVPL